LNFEVISFAGGVVHRPPGNFKRNDREGSRARENIGIPGADATRAGLPERKLGSHLGWTKESELSASC